jgi:hypothetical protein
MKIGAAMKLGLFFAALFLAAFPVGAATVFVIDPTQGLTITLGGYASNQTVFFQVTGAIDLLGPDGSYPVKPDGSLVSPIHPSCTGCFTAAYAAYVNPGAISALYPTGNPFPGGGTNYDLQSPNPFPPVGKQTTDATDPGVIRLGALAYTFAVNPTPTDWKVLVDADGNGNISTESGGTLRLVIADTAYWNDTGSYTVTVLDPAPEPSAAWLAFSGIALLGLTRVVRRYRAR